MNIDMLTFFSWNIIKAEEVSGDFLWLDFVGANAQLREI